MVVKHLIINNLGIIEMDDVPERQFKAYITIFGIVYFESQMLVHEYWTILDHFGIPVLLAS